MSHANVTSVSATPTESVNVMRAPPVRRVLNASLDSLENSASRSVSRRVCSTATVIIDVNLMRALASSVMRVSGDFNANMSVNVVHEERVMLSMERARATRISLEIIAKSSIRSVNAVLMANVTLLHSVPLRCVYANKDGMDLNANTNAPRAVSPMDLAMMALPEMGHVSTAAVAGLEPNATNNVRARVSPMDLATTVSTVMDRVIHVIRNGLARNVRISVRKPVSMPTEYVVSMALVIADLNRGTRSFASLSKATTMLFKTV